VAVAFWIFPGLVAGLTGAGIFLARHDRAHKKHQAQRRLPQQWPLNPRLVVNSAERAVWHWLKLTFPDKCVMLKLPLTRFTTPQEAGAANDWFELLSGAYCTFTICDEHGRALGCIDVPGARGISRHNRRLKQTLLAQCGIAYWAFTHDDLPESDTLRIALLGEDSAMPPSQTTEQARLEAAATSLHQALDRNRRFRPPSQPDSFLGALDSRGALLESEELSPAHE
jgi:hypothetical protein